MKPEITCAVCDRPKIEADICPNCETDLSLIRMLVELPPAEKPTKLQSWPQAVPWQIGEAAMLLVIGIGLGVISNMISSQSLLPTIQSPAPTPTQVAQQVEALRGPRTKSCGGLYYTVRSGDGLSQLAWHIYGNANLWRMIAQANPKLKSRENVLQIGEVLFVPNREQSCP